MLGKGSLVASFSVHTVTPVLRRHPELHCNMCPVREAPVLGGEQRKLCLTAHCWWVLGSG